MWRVCTGVCLDHGLGCIWGCGGVRRTCVLEGTVARRKERELLSIVGEQGLDVGESGVVEHGGQNGEARIRANSVRDGFVCDLDIGLLDGAEDGR